MKILRCLVLIVVGLIVFGLTMTFAFKFQGTADYVMRGGLLLVLGLLWLAARGDGAFGQFRPIFLAYFAIVAGLSVAWYGGPLAEKALHVDASMPLGNAMEKAIQAAIVAATVIVIAMLAGRKPASLHLRKGRLALGLAWGLVGFLIFVGLSFVPGGPGLKVASTAGGVAKLAAIVPAVALFAFTNAFMEELLFRGILLERVEALTGKWLALFATTIVFAAAHVQVTYTSQLLFFLATVLVLGFLWGLLMQKSKSIWGSVLFHAGADIAIILPIYQSMHG